MAWLGTNAHLLAKCHSCWMASGSAVRMRAGRPLGQTARFASTQSKPRPTKSTAATDVSAVPKKKISTKSTTSTSAKTSSTKKAGPAPSVAAAEKTPVTAVKKTTRAASTRAAPVPPKAPVKKKAEIPIAARKTPMTTSPATKATPVVAAKTQQTPKPAENAAAAQAKKPDVSTARPSGPSQVQAARTPTAPAPIPLPVSRPKTAEVKIASDPAGSNSKERREASGINWIRTIVGLPILIVTSYLLFDRLVMGNDMPRNLEEVRKRLSDNNLDHMRRQVSDKVGASKSST